MLKTFSKYAHVVLALSLIASATADAKPSGSSSFKGGFSSQRSSSSSSSKPRGGFGSFGSAPAADSRKSDSALSRRMDKERSEASALRTLDERRAAQAAREARPAPGYSQPAGGHADDRRAPPQAPIIVNNSGGSGLGHVVAGAIIARSAANAHANNDNNGGGYYPAPSGGAGGLANRAGADAVHTTAADTGGLDSIVDAVVVAFIWLCVPALAAWVLYAGRKRKKRRREAGKPNYSFERN